MYASHRDMIEKFSGKSKDSSKRSENKQSRQMRDKRRNRHAESQ